MTLVEHIEAAPKPIRLVAYAMIAVVFALTAAAVRWEGTWTAAAVGAWGMVLCTAGGLAMSSRRFRTGERAAAGFSYEREHRGVAAIMMGAALAVIGFALIIGACAYVLGAGAPLSDLFFGKPGIPLLTAGLWSVLVGVSLVISRFRILGETTAWWQRLPAQFTGVLATVVGTALLLLGVNAIRRDQSWTALLEQLLRVFGLD